MNTALIFAGGSGQRMNSRTKPKQFLELFGKPIILYTLEHFERHPQISNIVVVCLKNWIDDLRILLKRYDISKVTCIVPGGATGHESIYNGLCALGDICKDDDIVLIHDGVRPLINEQLISENIIKAHEYGTAITVEAVSESVVHIGVDSDLIDKVPSRAEMYIAKAPQSFQYKMIRELYDRARTHGIASIDSAHLLSIYGVEMHMVKSTPNNMKITTAQDYYIFKALYEAMENQQILGF